MQGNLSLTHAGAPQCQISPSPMLNITKGGLGSVMCTAPYACQNVLEFQFKEQDGYDILDINILSPLLSHITYDGTPQTCTSAINISWTTDAQIRRKLDTLYCVFNMNTCRTESISIVFEDQDSGKTVYKPCSYMYYNAMH